MGMRFRKSINLGGGARVNLSKSGIGYSLGTKGARITKKSSGGTRRTLSVPGTGVSYVKESGTGKRSSTSSPKTSRGGNKCPECGALIGNSTVCEYCGAQISYEMRREQEKVNMKGCPECGSSNITFRREQQGVSNSKNGARIVYTTTGVCMDCGNTWYSNATNATPKKNNTVWWVLGWIFCFPVPVMILIWRKKCTWTKPVKIGVTVAFWILFMLTYLIAGGSSDNKSTEQNPINEENAISQSSNNEILENNNNEIKDESSAETDTINAVETTKSDTEVQQDVRATQTMVATEKVKVREQPNTDCAVLGMLAAGASIPVYEQQDNGWSLVDYDGKEAYVKSDYLASGTEGNQQVDPIAVIPDAGTLENNENGIVQSPGGDGNPDIGNYQTNPDPAGGYIVNASNGKIHYYTCYKLPEPENRVYFNSLEEARAAGYSDLCGVCME